MLTTSVIKLIFWRLSHRRTTAVQVQHGTSAAAVQQQYRAAVQQQYRAAVQQQCRAAVQQQCRAAVQQRYRAAVQQQAGCVTTTVKRECDLSKRVLVIGATGVAGSAFVEHIREHQYLANNGTNNDASNFAAIDRVASDNGVCDWQVIGVSRHVRTAGASPDSNSSDSALRDSVSFIQADLLTDYTSIKSLHDITHVVFAGFVPAPDFQQQVAPNRDILINCIRALESNPLQRIVLIQGMKYYGSHLGAFKTPAREDDPRHAGENYYYAQQDVLEQSGIDWTCLRPHVICGTSSIGTPQNILSVIGVYASLMRETGQPLSWPGSVESFTAINQATDARLLARAIEWSLNSDSAANQAYNVTNGDFFRWQHLWPKIAELFRMQAGEVSPQSLSDTMPLLASQWQELIDRHELKPGSMESIVNWPFADYILRTGWDVIGQYCQNKAVGLCQLS